MINIEERHEYWWNFLLERMSVWDNFNRELPKIKFVIHTTKAAARANEKECTYNLNYAIQEGDEYDETVCHEICHSFTMRLFPWCKHGLLWRYAFNVVCRSKRGEHHEYREITHKKDRPKEIEVIQELLKLQKKIAVCENQR